LVKAESIGRMNPIKLSVIVPAYNAERDIPVLIRALRHQTVQPFEAILVDDASTDRTAEIASSYFKVIRMPRQAGPAAARNLGIHQARGNAFAFIDSDCRPNPDWVETVMAALSSDGFEVVTGGVFIHARTVMGRSIAALGYPGGGSLGFENMWRVSEDGRVEKLCSGNMGIRRGLIERIGGFDEGFPYSFEDAWLAHLITRAGVPIHYVKPMDVEHKPMERFTSFVRWHYRRGEGMAPFRDRVGRLDRFVNLRLWSTWNLIRTHILNPTLPLILILLCVSVVVQKVASVEYRRKTT
jgi:glycosyltransferase involved in cell wall biosynthesis